MRVLNGSRLFLRPKQYDHENVFEFSRLLDISVHFIFSVYLHLLLCHSSLQFCIFNVFSRSVPTQSHESAYLYHDSRLSFLVAFIHLKNPGRFRGKGVVGSSYLLYDKNSYVSCARETKNAYYIGYTQKLV